MIIITGASRGIGNYLLNEFAKNHDVVGIYNNTKVDSKAAMHKVDITLCDSINEFIENNRDKLSNITLINCAGANYSAFAHKVDHNKWANLINTNLIGTFNIISMLLPFMREQQYGRIINMSSVVAQIGIPGTSAYAASKSGLWGMTKALAVENASKGITINTLNLGYYEIGMINEVSPEMQNIVKEKIPQKKFGDPINILNAVKFLIDSPYITGTNIDMNGGLF
jgi:NAD(P)-dependent dehydrogenase (short-subunit alcohol dehydrogenase family)